MNKSTEEVNGAEGYYHEIVYFCAFLSAFLCLTAEMLWMTHGLTPYMLVMTKGIIVFLFCLYGDLKAPTIKDTPFATSLLIGLFCASLYVGAMMVGALLVRPHFPLQLQGYLALTITVYAVAAAGAMFMARASRSR